METNNSPVGESKPKLTPAQRQKLKKYAVFALLLVIFGACMWLIFSPSSGKKAKEESTHGFNPDIPLPKEKGIVKDKQVAYEEEQDRQKQEEKVRSLQDFAAMLGQDGKNKPSQRQETSFPGNGTSTGTVGNANRFYAGTRPSSIQSSVSAYRDINRTLGAFYDTPKQDPEKERLAKELEAVKAKLAENETRKNNVDDQVSLMEKSYQMAAKYIPQMQGQVQSTCASSGIANGSIAARNGSGKTPVVPVSQVASQTVSSLGRDGSNTSPSNRAGQQRNEGFITPTSTVSQETKNTIAACIHTTQTVMDGQNVRLRLLEPVHAGTLSISGNAVITGVVKVQGERLDITVSSLEYEGSILPVALSVYDTDGQRGIFIPNTAAVSAAKEMVANMGTTTGTSISLAGNAGGQLAADMGRSLIQGASQFVSKKLREVKITLKAGYKVFLLPNDKQNAIQ